MITGALILLAGIGIGWLLRSLPARPRGPKPVEAVCGGCDHHYSMHDPKTGECQASVPVDKYDQAGKVIGVDYPGCACVRYSGPVPYPEYFAPEIAEG